MSSARKFLSTLDPKPFSEALNCLAVTIAPLPVVNDSGEMYLSREDYDYVTALLDEAEKAHQANQRDAAWFYLTVATAFVNYQCGLEEGKFRSQGAGVFEEHLRDQGRSGGLKAGKSFETLREAAAKAILERTPSEGWPTKAAFDIAYHEIAAPILGEHNTEHQRKALLKRDDIRAKLPKGMTRKR